MADRRIKQMPDIADKVHDCFYQITHATHPLQIKEIETIIKKASFVFPKQSAEKRMFIKEMQTKVYNYFITNQNHD